MSMYSVAEREAARHVLWVFFGDREFGWQPGSFTEALVGAFARADALNFERLRAAFPAVGWAVACATREPEGRKLLMLAVES